MGSTSPRSIPSGRAPRRSSAGVSITRTSCLDSGPHTMRLYERELELAAPGDRRGWIDHLARSVGDQLEEGEYPVRFVVSSTEPGGGGFHGEVGVLDGGPDR